MPRASNSFPARPSPPCTTLSPSPLLSTGSGETTQCKVTLSINYLSSPLLAANSLFSNPLLMFGQKSHLEILEEHRKLIERFGLASATSKSKESFDEKPVKAEDPIDLTFKTSDDDRCEDED